MSNMINFLVADETEAERICAGLYRLRRPTAVRDPRDVTLYMGEWVVVNGGDVYVRIPEEVARLHPDSSSRSLDTLLNRSHVGNGERNRIRGRINSNKGNRIQFRDLIPDIDRANVVTDEFLDNLIIESLDVT